MARWLAALFLFVALFGTGLGARAVDETTAAADSCRLADTSDGLLAAADAAEATGNDAGSEATVDATAVVESLRALPHAPFSHAAPRQVERPAASPPYLEGLRRPPRA